MKNWRLLPVDVKEFYRIYASINPKIIQDKFSLLVFMSWVHAVWHAHTL